MLDCFRPITSSLGREREGKDPQEDGDEKNFHREMAEFPLKEKETSTGGRNKDYRRTGGGNW